MMRQLGLIAFLMIWLAPAAAALAGSEATVRQLFDEGNARYRQLQFEPAAGNYEAALHNGFDSGPLYFNLGNARLKAGQIGQAIWAYHNAKQLIPRDHDLDMNIAYAQLSAAEAVLASVKPPAWLRWVMLDEQLSLRELVVLTGFLGWLSAAAWVLRGWRLDSPGPLRARAWVVTIAWLLSFVILAAQSSWQQPGRRAVAVQATEARFSPQESGTVHFALPEGTVVDVRHREPGWVQIQRGDGRTGWVAQGSVRDMGYP
jgi:hypothetical protein